MTDSYKKGTLINDVLLVAECVVFIENNEADAQCNVLLRK